MFSLSLGGTCPKDFPNTELGTTVNPSAAAAPALRNFLLEILDAIIDLV
jgi:hypothetical protein